MNTIEEKENIENQEEPNEQSPKDENEKKEEPNSPVKAGDEIGGDLLNLEAENESSIEAKDKEDQKEDEHENAEQEKKDEEKGNLFKSDEDENEEGEAEGEGADEEEQNSLDEEIRMNNAKKKEVEKKTREKTLESVKLQYKYKLSLIENKDEFKQIYEKFWNLLPKTFEGDISKESFVCLLSKILKILLPLFNYSQIPKYCDGIWKRYVKGKPTMTLKIFEKVIFRLTHLLSVHVNHYEYEDTLNLIYDRITCIKKYSPNGEEKIFYPSIKITLYNSLSKEEYQNCTWEIMNNEMSNNELFEQFEEGGDENSEEKQNQENNSQEEEKEKPRKIRPRLKIIDDFGGESNEGKENKVEENKNFIKPNSYYENDRNMFLYSEDVFYAEKEEIDKISEELNCHIKYELMDDSELIIYGYPTQYILNKFINNMKDLEDIQTQPNSEYDSTFYITDYQPYEKRKIYLKLVEKEKLVNFLKENTSFILIRDDFQTNPNIQLGADFSEDLLNIVNNLRRNLSFDRYFDIYEIKLPNYYEFYLSKSFWKYF